MVVDRRPLSPRHELFPMIDPVLSLANVVPPTRSDDRDIVIIVPESVAASRRKPLRGYDKGGGTGPSGSDGQTRLNCMRAQERIR